MTQRIPCVGSRGVADRLRKEGRMNEALRYWNKSYNLCLQEGMVGKEASEMAWGAVVEKFPPMEILPPPPERPKRGRPPKAMAEALLPAIAEGWKEARGQERRDKPDLVSDILWVYANLENDAAVAGTAPSVGAWSMLVWARTYRNRFFEQLLPKALPKVMVEKGAGREDVRDESLEEAERLLRQITQAPGETLPTTQEFP